MTTYLYQKEVSYVSFKKRWWDKAQLVVYLLGFQAFIILTLALVFQAYWFVFVALFLGVGGFINAYIYRKRMRYFLQSIRINQEQMVHMDLYDQDENQAIFIPLSEIQVKFERSSGKDRHVKVTFFKDKTLLGKQFDYQEWKLESLVEIFVTIKELKNETLTAYEKRMISKKGLFI